MYAPQVVLLLGELILKYCWKALSPRQAEDCFALRANQHLAHQPPARLAKQSRLVLSRSHPPLVQRIKDINTLTPVGN